MGREKKQRKSKKRITKALWLLTYFGLLFILGTPWRCKAEQEPAYKEDSPQMQVFFLLQENDGTLPVTVRAGRKFCLGVAISTDSSPFSGEINVLMLNAAENHVQFSESIRLESKESRIISIILPMNLMTEGLYITLTADGKVLSEQTLPLEVVNYGSYFLIGICAENVSEYDYFRSYGNQLIALQEEDFSYGADALDALDIVIAEESWLKNASETATACLQKWLEQGRLLVIGSKVENSTTKGNETGSNKTENSTTKENEAGSNKTENSTIKGNEAGGNSTGNGWHNMTLNLGLQDRQLLQNIISKISSYESERNSVLAENEELRKQYGSNTRTCYVGDSMIGPMLVNSLSDEAVKLPVQEPQEKNGGWWMPEENSLETLWLEGGSVILAKSSFGMGNVLISSIPLSTAAREVYPLFYYRLAQMIQENVADDYLSKLNEEKYGTNWSGNSYLLSYFDQKGEGIRVTPYLVILGFYIIFVIPAVFLLLRSFGRSKYLWGIIPAVSFLMVFIIYGMGKNTRIEKPYCSYLNIIDYTKKDAEGVLNLQLSAPTNKGAKISLSGKAFVQLDETSFAAYHPVWNASAFRSENLLKARNYKAAIVWGEEETTMELNNIAAFSKTRFQVFYKVEPEGSFKCSIQAGDECLEGSISNQTGIDYQNIYLYGSNVILEMDGFQAQKTTELYSCNQVYFDSMEAWYDENLVSQVFGKSPYNGENAILLNVMYDFIRERDGEGCYLFAIPEEKTSQNPLGDVTENPHSQGIEIRIYPFEISEKEEIKTVDFEMSEEEEIETVDFEISEK